MRRWGHRFALVLAVGLSASAAQADATVWSRAANPESHARDALIGKVDALLNEYVHLRQTPTAFRRAMVLSRARRLLERAGAASSEDVAIRLRLAQVYYRLYDVEGDADRLEQAIAHYQWAARAPLPTMTKARILNSLAICLARLGRHPDEVGVYDAAIAIEPDPESQAVLRANQAEGYMAQGRILDAIRGYRAALEATPTALMIESGVTTMWGLAVALDRSGDLDGALDHVERARSYDPFDRRIHGSGWFYVPPYDEDWYAALGHWQHARLRDEPAEDRLASYDAAIAAWRSYMNRAPMTDQWLPIAAVRLRACEKERERFRDRATKRPSEQRDRPGPRKDLRWPN